MAYYLGIDIGTSGAKVLLIDEAGQAVASDTREYGLSTPRPLWAEPGSPGLVGGVGRRHARRHRKVRRERVGDPGRRPLGPDARLSVS